jgi:L-rhamnose isomerase
LPAKRRNASAALAQNNDFIDVSYRRVNAWTIGNKHLVKI